MDASMTDFERWWFLSMPFTFRSSTAMAWLSRTASVVALCIASLRWFAILSWILANRLCCFL